MIIYICIYVYLWGGDNYRLTRLKDYLEKNIKNLTEVQIDGIAKVLDIDIAKSTK
jgi:hypothetical protein